MNIELLRYSDNQESTTGLLFINGKFFCHTLEDRFRDVKVKGTTRIPDGTYDLGIRKESTPLTLKYREKYSFFKNHIEILNIPNYSGVYIHIGNNAEHTDGCVLLGNVVNNNTKTKGQISDSTSIYKDFYELVYPELEKSKITIWIHQYYKS